MDFNSEVKNKAADIEEILKKYLPKEEGYQKTVIEAMNYSVLSGGKRLRPMLMQETYRLFGGEDDIVEYYMTALEMIHTYSLVHDDLPCMDNDEYRRGRKTTHAVYGPGIATLAGDALLNYAAEVVAMAISNAKEPEKAAEAMKVLFGKSGVFGMIGGQTADVISEDKPCEDITEELLMYIHKNKTAALIEAAMMIGGILAGANDITVRTLEKIAYNVGIAFQIQDDILDVTSTFEQLGKPIGSDERNHKVTYVSLHGLAEAASEVERLSEEAITLLHTLPGENVFLEELLKSLIDRKN
ncbi:MAG: polyprenyl synthetase family protein [Lachnospiraceae bacterium]|nr:polyprenyl synthetase family protein [Candidatus Colinaster equi]